MKNNMEIFNSTEFGAVRIIKDAEDTFLFCGMDVATALGYAKPRNAINTHCRYALKRGVPHPQAPDKVMEMLFIPEGDVYRLIIHSKLPAAEKFEHWLFDEVLSSIRKYGAYITPEMRAKLSRNPSYIQELVDMLQREEARSAELREKVEMLTQREAMLSELNEGLLDVLIEAYPKVSFYDEFIALGCNTSLTITAKEIGVSVTGLVRFLTGARFLYRAPGGELLPYQKWLDAGYFVVKDYASARGHVGAYTLVTPKGKVFLHELLGELTEKSDS